MTASFPTKHARSSSQVFFFGLCAAAVHHWVAWRLSPALRPLPWSVAAACVFFFLLRPCLQSRRAGLCQGGDPWRAMGRALAPRSCRSPGGITLRASQEGEKRRSNRQGAWRESLPSGAAHSPAGKEPSNNTGAQRPGGGGGPRSHHTARQSTPVPPGLSVRLLPCTRSACDRCPPGETSGRPQRHASGGCHPAVAVRLARGAPPWACRGASLAGG